MFLGTIDEDKGVFAGGVVDLDDGGAIFKHGQVAEHIKLHLLSESNFNLLNTTKFSLLKYMLLILEAQIQDSFILFSIGA